MSELQARVRWGDRWLATVRGSWMEKGRHGRRNVTDLQLTPGEATARVRDGRNRPYRVTVALPVLSEDEWAALLDRLAGQLRYTARLLEGELPADVEDLAADAGIDLLPSDVDGSCTCGRTRCRHLAAVHHAIAAALDVDAFGLLRLRGRDRQRLLEDLRSRRSSGPVGEGPAAPGELAVADLDGVDLFAPAGDVDAVRLHPARTEEPGALLERLGVPPGVDDPHEIEAIIARAVDTAWKLAAGAGTVAADEELVLAELRAQRFGTAASVAAGIGWDVDRTRAELDRLYEEGQVMRTGKGDKTKYRAQS